MNEFNNELLEKAKSAKSPEEVLAIAKENNIKLTEEMAKNLYGKMHKTGELSDDELNNVAGGGCGKYREVTPGDDHGYVCPNCGASGDKIIFFNSGECCCCNCAYIGYWS